MLGNFRVHAVTLFCFGASYAVALGLELLRLFRPQPILRGLALLFCAAGLLAHTIFLIVQNPPLASQFGTVLFLGWILAVFALYGSIHHSRVAWNVFVLPLVLALVGMAATFERPDADPQGVWLSSLVSFHGERFWGAVHGSLVLLAAVGVCVAFLASVMYLVQARRLRTKTLPGQGMALLSLERLEEMNRRAITVAFPLLTAGMLIGAVIMLQQASQLRGLTDPRVLTTLVLWVVFAILLYLRYGAHRRGTRMALWTIVAFVCLLVTLAVPHTLGQGGTP